jgi:hypothetical protein
MPGLLPLFKKEAILVVAAKPSPPPIYHLRPIIQPTCPMRSPGLWAGPGLRSLRSWIGLGGDGLGVTYPTVVFNRFQRALKPIVPLAAASSPTVVRACLIGPGLVGFQRWQFGWNHWKRRQVRLQPFAWEGRNSKDQHGTRPKSVSECVFQTADITVVSSQSGVGQNRVRYGLRRT